MVSNQDILFWGKGREEIGGKESHSYQEQCHNHTELEGLSRKEDFKKFYRNLYGQKGRFLWMVEEDVQQPGQWSGTRALLEAEVKVSF